MEIHTPNKMIDIIILIPKKCIHIVVGKILKITYNMTATIDTIIAYKAVCVIFFIVFMYR